MEFMKKQWFIVCLCGGICAALANDLERLPGAVLLPVAANDGDSFRIAVEDREFVIRLYFIDCPEKSAATSADARRVREQTRYFGLPDEARAFHWGREAAAFTRQQLNRPFTVYTAYASALGRSKEGRIYGFVETADGKDLGGLLVQHGYARPQGVRRALPDGTHRDEALEQLNDYQTVAILKRRGIWSETDPDRLVALRAAARLEEADLNTILEAESDRPLNLNTATDEELQTISGVGPVTARRIIGNRPYNTPEDLDAVPRLPETVRERILERAVWP